MLKSLLLLYHSYFLAMTSRFLLDFHYGEKFARESFFYDWLLPAVFPSFMVATG